MPSNTDKKSDDIHPILLRDLIQNKNKLIRKFYYLYRSLINPFRLRRYLQTQPPSVVLFNDFDQLTALLWPYFFKTLQQKHLFAVLLHDPDRDSFFRWKWLSEQTMKNIMSLMSVAFYHGYLPHKSYYEGNFLKVSVPHGIYENKEINAVFLHQLKSLTAGYCVVGILGNIRDEKNYEIVIDALINLKEVKLLIAGKAANSGVSIDAYKNYAKQKGVEQQIIWVEEYLNGADFNAAIEVCDVVLLYYKASFTSQSGVLNTIAPFRKKLIVSDIKSSLTKTVKKYQLGAIVPPNDVVALTKVITELCHSDIESKSGWQQYIADVSWGEHVAIAIDSYKKIKNEW